MSQKTKLSLANPRGFCAGVDRAIEIVNRALDMFGSPIYVKHEVVHNKAVVDDLKERGAIFIEEISDVPDDSIIIFSAHGVSSKIEESVKSRNLKFFDATCPLVTKVHMEVMRHGRANRDIILIGHEGHPEVEGTMGRYFSQNGKIYLVQDLEEAKEVSVNQPENLAYVTQTTLSVDETKDIINELMKRFPNIVAPKKDDICYATTNRQEAVKKIANQCDYFLVIGASNSSNSLRLVEVAKNYGSKKAILVEDVDSLNLNIFQESENIGITASASSPEVLVKKLLDNLKRNFEIHINEGSYQKEDVFFKVPQKLNV